MLLMCPIDYESSHTQHSLHHSSTMCIRREHGETAGAGSNNQNMQKEMHDYPTHSNNVLQIEN